MSSYNCKKCGKKTKYSEAYDTYYCLDCNLWNETPCGDPDCHYCEGIEKGSPRELLKIEKHFNLSLGFLGDKEAAQTFEKLIEDNQFRGLLKGFGVSQLTDWHFSEVQNERSTTEVNEIEQLKKQLQQREVDLMETELKYKEEIKQLEAANKRIHTYYKNKTV